MSEPQAQTTDLVSHTPGPWGIQSSRTTVTVRSAGSGEVISSWYAGQPTGTVTHANARLIAAAPELLGAIKELLASQMAPYPPFEAGKDAQNAWSDRRAKACSDAEVVIALAEGKL